ncbi:27479_t:CDS:2, partial [Gigaspora margarita]
GYMTFKKWAVEFIDTKAFQRLRNIKQLGNSYYIFPGACHNHFEHSLGTAHLAYTLTKKLLEQPGIERVNSNLEYVTLAALCHDLEHGLFSPVFDGDWKHENGSEKMFDYLYDKIETHSIDLSTDDLKFIKNLIK